MRPVVVSRGHVTGTWLFMAAFLIACNPEAPTGPSFGDSPIDGIRPSFSGFEGGTVLGIPGNNGPTAYGGVAWFDLFTVPKGHFFQIDVTGTISSMDSGNCNPSIGATGTWGPFGHNGTDGRVNFSTSPWQGGIPTTAPGSTMTLNNIYMSADVTISVSRSIFWGTCSPDQTAGLNLGGGQTIEWKVAVPFEVLPSTTVFASGDSVTFTATSEWSTTNNSWRWRANDTTAVPLGSWPAAEIVHCGSSSTCKFAPTTPGRMYRVGTAPAPALHELATPSPIVWKDAAPNISLQLASADSNVARGTEVEFQVRNTGRGGELFGTAINWRFEPDSVKYYDNSVSPKFRPPIVEDLDADSTWRGPIVHPGMLIVTGVGPSNTAADTIVLSVSPRSWDPPQVVLSSGAYNWHRPPNPSGSSPANSFGRLHTYPPDDAWPDELFFDGVINVAVVLPGGPNAGYAYITSASLDFIRSYSLSEWIDNPGASYFGSTTWQYLQSLNPPEDPNLFRDYTIAHEVGDEADVNSHLGMHNAAGVNFAACGDVVQAVERLVTGDTASLNFRISQARTNSAKTTLWISGHRYVFGHQAHPNPVADWVSIPGVQRNLLDTQLLSNAPLDSVNWKPPASHCDLGAFIY